MGSSPRAAAGTAEEGNRRLSLTEARAVEWAEMASIRRPTRRTCGARPDETQLTSISSTCRRSAEGDVRRDARFLDEADPESSRREADRVAAKEADRLAREEAERLEAAREAERLEAERAEAERIEVERVEAARARRRAVMSRGRRRASRRRRPAPKRPSNASRSRRASSNCKRIGTFAKPNKRS